MRTGIQHTSFNKSLMCLNYCKFIGTPSNKDVPTVAVLISPAYVI